MDKNQTEEWYGQEVQTETTELKDLGKGKPYILRSFEFAINPEVKVIPTKQELFDSHWPHIKILIWSDGLIANEDIAPRIVIGPEKYQIFVLCEPKTSNVILDKPQTLQDIFKK